jgi:integrase
MTPRRLLDVRSRDEIQALEDAAVSERDKLIIRFLADTGMRAGELVGLRTSDLVDRDRNHFVRVTGKGSGNASFRYHGSIGAWSATSVPRPPFDPQVIPSSSRFGVVPTGTWQQRG